MSSPNPPPPPPLHPSCYNAQVIVRPPTGLLTPPIPSELLFLHSPSPPHAYRIRIRHPAYADTTNVLLSLYAWDRADGGIQYGLAHTACAIIANNRFDGYFSEVRDPHGPRITLAWDDVLPNNHHGYYFHVDDDKNNNATTPATTDPSQTPYRWPVVPSFLDWQFPHNRLPSAWQNCAAIQRDASSSAQSDQSGAVQRRGVVCRMSAHTSSTEVAHLVPAHERAWFETNGMGEYNSNTTLDAGNLLHDPNNALLLRADLHKAFDARKFCFFPKGDDGFVVHVLQPAPDLRLLYHNTRISITQCEKSRLVVQWDETREDWVESEVPAHVLAQKSMASRSTSPTKRSRITSSATEHDEQYRGRPFSRRRRSMEERPDQDDARPAKTRRLLPAFSEASSPTGIGGSGTQDLPEDWLSEKMSSATQSFQAAPPSHVDTPQTPPPSCVPHLYENTDGRQSHKHQDFLPPRTLERLRQEALAQQRPPEYIKPFYKEDGDLWTQLEFMGIDILDNLSQ